LFDRGIFHLPDFRNWGTKKDLVAATQENEEGYKEFSEKIQRQFHPVKLAIKAVH